MRTHSSTKQQQIFISLLRVLQEQAGNSLEMSLLLVSLLRGLGYKVYVVLGKNKYTRTSVLAVTQNIN